MCQLSKIGARYLIPRRQFGSHIECWIVASIWMGGSCPWCICSIGTIRTDSVIKCFQYIILMAPSIYFIIYHITFTHPNTNNMGNCVWKRITACIERIVIKSGVILIVYDYKCCWIFSLFVSCFEFNVYPYL